MASITVMAIFKVTEIFQIHRILTIIITFIQNQLQAEPMSSVEVKKQQQTRLIITYKNISVCDAFYSKQEKKTRFLLFFVTKKNQQIKEDLNLI